MKFIIHFGFALLLTLGMFCTSVSKAQVGRKGIPESFLFEQKTAVLIPFVKLNPISFSKLIAEDNEYKIENRYGLVQSCVIDIKEAGIKTEIPGKGAIWRYKIESENALSLGISFQKYRLPENASVFIYNSSETMVRGAFTKYNNRDSKSLSIAEFPGKSLIIEYFEPDSPEFSGELVLGSVSQAYKNLKEIAEDRIGINCPEGDGWQIVKHAVCLMTFHDVLNSYFCSGALINNAKEDETPYFLTANHCINSEEVAETLITYFDYENSSCTADDASFSKTLSGATFKAGSKHSDFSLLLLIEYPPDEYNPYYAGWDVSGENPQSAACIHHPDGNPKCIATASNTAFSYPEKIQWYSEDLTLISTTLPDTHWFALFDQGRPEEGSSGSPLFDQNKRIVGQLHGGVNSVLLFGKLSLSWDYNLPNNEQLACWLDPYKTHKILDGIWKIPPKSNFRSELQEVCVNSPVKFTDQSTHRPTEWQWHIDPSSYNFTNGTDSASQNPQVLFLKDGAYSVKLRTTNQYGSNELIQEKYIVARSKLDVRFLKSRVDSAVCGCDLKSFPLFVGGAVKYRYKLENPELLDTVTSANSLLLSLRASAKLTNSFKTWVKVTGTNGQCIDSDSILLHVTIQPNDNIANAARLVLGRNSGFSNKCATVEPNEPNPPSSGCTSKKSWCPELRADKTLLDNSIWFKFVAPANGVVSINTYGFDDQIAIYEASSFQSVISGDKRNFNIVAANDNRSLSDKTSVLEDVELAPGELYWLQVDGNAGAFGSVTIDLLSNALDAEVFPNPSNGNFNLNIFHPENGEAEVSVVDLNGKELIRKTYKVNVYSTTFNFNLNGFSKGVYILRVYLNGASMFKKLVYF